MGSTVLERGDIAFLYRPRVGRDRPRSLEDVQRLFLALTPDGRGLYRLLTVGRKRMPAAEERGHARYWGFVARVEEDPRRLRGELEPTLYRTRTRGLRHQPGVRVAGEGAYRIVRHDDHTHLSYELFAPRDLGRLQEDLHLQPQATYVLAVMNPARPAPPGVERPEPQDPHLPPELMLRFRGRRYAPADPAAFLDHVGLELLLVAAGDHATVGEDDVATGRPEPPRAAEDLGLAPVTAGAGDDWSD